GPQPEARRDGPRLPAGRPCRRRPPAASPAPWPFRLDRAAPSLRGELDRAGASCKIVLSLEEGVLGALRGPAAWCDPAEAAAVRSPLLARTPAPPAGRGEDGAERAGAGARTCEP